MKPTQHAFRFMKWNITLDCESAGRGRIIVVRDEGSNAPDDLDGYQWKMRHVRIKRGYRSPEWVKLPKRTNGWAKLVCQLELHMPWWFRVLPGPRGYTTREAIERVFHKESNH